METLLFLIYINDLPDNLQFTGKMFTDDTSFWQLCYYPTASQLDSDLKKNSDLTYIWKMTFYPVLSKQAQENIFSRKTVKISQHAFYYF